MEKREVYIGIDFGTKRIGVAFSDESGSIAMPYKVLKNDKDALTILKTIIDEKGAEKIVIGRSINSKGIENKVQQDIDLFKKDMKAVGITQEIIDQLESFTSSHVEVKNDMLDASAAALILQRFLDKEKFKNK